MIFTSPLFVVYLCISLLLYGLLYAFFMSLLKNKQLFIEIRTIFLLIISLLFYSAWNPKYLLLLVWISVVDFNLAGQISRKESDRPRKWLTFLSLGNSLLVLCLFKYLGFFQESLLDLIRMLGMEAHMEVLRLVLPVGISFYIFQSISYILDVYRRKIPAEGNYLHYLFYLSFFPQLVAGPIVQAKDFLPQISRLVPFSKTEFRFALVLLLLGAFKKSVLADHLAMTADFSFSHTSEVDREFLWLGLLSYSGQIYCDFSGYTDIAQGAALLFGFHLPENFRMPYLSRGFSEFWKRWHMSLSSWLKSYLYIPLGGNRKGVFRTYMHLVVVMLLGGLWHGASWNFVLWGFGHGIFLVLEKMIKSFFQEVSFLGKRILEKIWNICYVAFTFVCVSFLWIFFRSVKLSDSLCYLQGLFVENGSISVPYTQSLVTYFCLAAIVFGHIYGAVGFQDNENLRTKLSKEQTYVNSILMGALFSLGFIGVVLMSGNSLPFVYFVF